MASRACTAPRGRPLSNGPQDPHPRAEHRGTGCSLHTPAGVVAAPRGAPWAVGHGGRRSHRRPPSDGSRRNGRSPRGSYRSPHRTATW